MNEAFVMNSVGTQKVSFFFVELFTLRVKSFRVIGHHFSRYQRIFCYFSEDFFFFFATLKDSKNVSRLSKRQFIFKTIFGLFLVR